MAKTIVIGSDPHCGSIYGITPPAYFEASDSRRILQEESWRAFSRLTYKWSEPDLLLINGDCIEGTQSKQGGAELITPDRNVQCDIFCEAFGQFRPKKTLITYGTKYHVGEQAEDFEYPIAQRMNAEIGGRLFFEFEGLVFDARHKVGSSSIPHGRATPLLREVAWNLIKEAQDTAPKVDVVIRSHVHYHIYIEYGDKIAFTTPGLQLARGRYGSRECVGETHWGMMRLTVENGKILKKETVLCKLQANRPTLIKIG